MTTTCHLFAILKIDQTSNVGDQDWNHRGEEEMPPLCKWAVVNDWGVKVQIFFYMGNSGKLGDHGSRCAEPAAYCSG